MTKLLAGGLGLLLFLGGIRLLIPLNRPREEIPTMRRTKKQASSGNSSAFVKEAPPSKELLEQLDQYYVVDVREPHERVETGYVPTSVNIPLAFVLEGTAKIEDDKPVLLVCRSGARSRRAGQNLVDRGYRDVTNLSTGTLGWIRDGFEVERVKTSS